MLGVAATLLAAAMALHHPQPEVLFAIRDDSQIRDRLAIEPVTMVTKAPGPCAGCWTLTFARPPWGQQGSEEARKFVKSYYIPGRTYRVLAGGAEVGTAKVEKETSLGCVSLAARVDVTPARSRRDASRLRVLAIGSLTVAPQKPVHRNLTDAEEKAVWRLARRELRQKHVSASLFTGLEGWNLISADLNHDGRRDVIGSFEVNDAKAQIRHRLFLIAMGDDVGGYGTDYVWYFRFLESVNEGSTETLELVDTIDLDEDGTDEVIVSIRGYEGNQYEILKRAGNKWKRVYRGGGSGC
jgi:hypothetical protein